ncbi:hypothetical protein PUV54_14700 [Hyphococcus flavus]|uniref:Uncharacterized protein n=1 Tax=Hyphococcus flavus TaxID=1866326 RepID=A0AAF0CFN7_9PROT|nr:hypothetical protein [Hyphococcus flavus]WDI31198.1 hypothetical protein PUV54_14700 [Hyphococcus flavus]
MTPRHWLLFAFIAVLLIAGVLLIVANGNRSGPTVDEVEVSSE